MPPAKPRNPHDVEIEYPKFRRQPWVPPHEIPKPPRPPAYVKPEGVTQKLNHSSLDKVWNHFTFFGNKAIISGSFSQNHKRFKLKSNGFQGAPNCVMACMFTNINKMENWDRNMLDRLLTLGDAQYERSLTNLADKSVTIMKVPQVYNTVYIGSFRLTFNVPGNPVQLTVSLENDQVGVVKKALIEFLKKYPSGIIYSEKRHIALWTKDKAYYLFDPTDHDENGARWRGLAGAGHSICARFSRLEHLVRYLIDDLKEPPGTLRLKIHPCTLLRFEKLALDAPRDLDEIKARKEESERARANATRPARAKEQGPGGDAKKRSPPQEKKPAPSREAIETLDELGPDAQHDPDAKRPSWLANIPLVKRVDKRAKIPAEPAAKPSVTNFNVIQEELSGILRGSTHQTDRLFSRFQDGEQSLSQAVAALVMRRLAPVTTKWSRRTVNQALKLGETIHHTSLRDAPEGPFKLDSVTKKITWEEKDFTPVYEELAVLGNLGTERSDVLTLLPALVNYFKTSDGCIVNGPITVSIWFDNGKYYMYDPNERDRRGRAILKRQIVGGEEVDIAYEPGYACVTWFADLRHLVALYMDNVPKERRRDDYHISKITIEDYVGLPDPWYNFSAVETGKWILRGSFSQASHIFKSETRNTQCTANAVMAIAFCHIRAPNEWSKKTVDQVLLSGDELYKATVDRLREQNKFVHRHLMVDEVNRSFPFSAKEAKFEIRDCLVNGMVDAPDAGDILNVRKGFAEFFRDNNYGVFTSQGISLAVWRAGDSFFYFDSHSRDEKGLITGYGTACLLRLLRIDDLADLVEANLGADGAHLYNISAVDVELLDADADYGVVRHALNAYQPLFEEEPFQAIVRATSSQKDPVYLFCAGKQTAPNCVAAIAMNRLRPGRHWTTETLDAILGVGNKYYMECMAEYEKNDDDDDRGITSKNLKPELAIGMNKFEVSLDVVAEGFVEDNLENAIVDFYQQNVDVTDEDNLELLLETENLTVSIWRDRDLFYTFDPYPRDEMGLVIGMDEWSERVEPESAEDAEAATPVAVDEEAEEEELEGEEDYEPQPRPRSRGEAVFDEDAASELDADADGKACAMLYYHVRELASRLLNCTRPNRRATMPFTLSRVRVAPAPDATDDRDGAYAGDWHAFKELDRGVWILRGTIAMDNATFPEDNRGKQAYAASLAAVAFARLFPLANFRPTNVNSVLIYGDRLLTFTKNAHRKRLRANAELRLLESEIDAIVKNEEYRLEDHARAIAIGDKKVAFAFEMQKVVGDVQAPHDSGDVLDLARGLDKFFQTNKFGLLECKNYVVAIWKGEVLKYMFDPHTTGVNGIKSPIGSICITRYLRTRQMADVFVQNLSPKGNKFFYIHAVSVKVEPYKRLKDEEEEQAKQKAEQVQRDVKITGYGTVVPGKSVLRGSLSQEAARFGCCANSLEAPAAFVALTMSLIHKSSTWARPIVDEILNVAERLFTATLNEMQFNPWEEKLDPYKVNKNFEIGVMRADCQLRECDQTGVLEIRDPKILNLRQGLERFFDENTHGIVYAPPGVCLAIWEDDADGAAYYLYDPNARGATGLPSAAGAACVAQFATLKIAAEHVLSCARDADERKREYTIIPVEIAVGPYRTRRKRCAARRAPPKKCDVVKEGMGRHLAHKTQAVERKVVKKKAAEAKKRDESRRLYWQGRTSFRALPRGAAIVRGTRSQFSDAYAIRTRGHQDIPNCVVAYVTSRIAPIDGWTYSEVDLILDVGNQLYVDSYIAYGPKDRKLGLKNVVRNIYIMNKKAHVTFYQPYVFRSFSAPNLTLALERCFLDETFCMIKYLDQYVGAFFTKGYYYLFDPYPRNASGARATKAADGAACAMRFERVDDLAQRVVTNLTPECVHKRVPEFWLVLVKLEGGICSCSPKA